MKESRIIVRVYGIYLDKQKGLLVSDELIKGNNITKFPGGGLEFGEGPIDCLKREMIEETVLNLKFSPIFIQQIILCNQFLIRIDRLLVFIIGWSRLKILKFQ